MKKGGSVNVRRGSKNKEQLKQQLEDYKSSTQLKEMTQKEAENPTIESLLGGRSQLDEEERLRYEVTESHNFYIPSN